MVAVLKLVLTDHWFEEIKSGRKTHEYREHTPFWEKRLFNRQYDLVLFQKAYRKNPERMLFVVKKIKCRMDGINTDLKKRCACFDIELGRRIPLASTTYEFEEKLILYGVCAFKVRNVIQVAASSISAENIGISPSKILKRINQEGVQDAQ